MKSEEGQASKFKTLSGDSRGIVLDKQQDLSSHVTKIAWQVRSSTNLNDSSHSTPDTIGQQKNSQSGDNS